MNAIAANPQITAVRQAARRFTDALAAGALLARTVRVEATLYADGAGSLFQLDEALTQAWPPAAGDPPHHEVIWARDNAEGFEELRFSAFDTAGRLLLRQAYNAAGRRAGPVDPG